MRTKVILGLVILAVAGGSFVAGIVVDRSLPLLFDSSVPVLLHPPSGAVLNKDKPTDWEFTWTKVPGAERYEVYLSQQDIGPSTREVEIPTYQVSNMQLLGTLKGWSWKVRAKVGGEWSEWSELRTFEVKPKVG